MDTRHFNGHLATTQRSSFMAAHSKTLFSSLVGAILAGDMLIVPIGKPFVEQETAYFATVLRVDSDGWVYLSWFSDDPQHTSTRMAPDGPFRWSDEQLALVDREGDVPIWYTNNISFELRGAQEAAAKYAAVPRIEQLQHSFTGDDMQGFITSDPRFEVIVGIGTNGEAGNLAEQLSLALNVLDVNHTKEQLVGIACFLLVIQSNTKAQVRVLLGQGGAAADLSNDGNLPH